MWPGSVFGSKPVLLKVKCCVTHQPSDFWVESAVARRQTYRSTYSAMTIVVK